MIKSCELSEEPESSSRRSDRSTALQYRPRPPWRERDGHGAKAETGVLFIEVTSVDIDRYAFRYIFIGTSY